MKKQINSPNKISGFILLCVILLAIQCRDDYSMSYISKDREIITRPVKTVYLGTGEMIENVDSAVLQLESDLNYSLDLPAIDSSKSDIEVRICYTDFFAQGFLRQRLNGEQLISELTNCGFDRNKNRDSFFFEIGNTIKSTIMTSRGNLMNVNTLPEHKVLIISSDKDKNGLDAGCSYFIQIKQHSTFKKIYINNPLENKDYDTDVKIIADYIKNLYSTFNFTMLDRWDSSEAHAFILPGKNNRN